MVVAGIAWQGDDRVPLKGLLVSPSPKFRLVALLAAMTLAADVRSATNEIAGRIGFSNTNPAILSVLGAPGNGGLFRTHVAAYSLPPAPFTSHDILAAASDPVAAPWSLTVEASAAGTAYDVTARAELGTWFLKDDYYFLPVTSPAVFEEPAPDAALDILECAGIIRVRFVDAGGAPVTVQGDRVTADSSAGGASPLGYVPAGSTTKDVIVRGDGSTYTVRAEITFGMDPFVDRMTQLRTATTVARCDEIVELPIVVDTPGSPALGTITGTLDILGEDEVVLGGSVANTRSRVEGAGPSRNLRATAIPGPPSAGAWTLGNLVASTAVNPPVAWSVKAEAAFGSGQDFRSFTTPSLPLMVDAGASVDAGNAFVIMPARVTGAVRLAGPPPGAGVSILQRLSRVSDRDANRDGVPDDLSRMFDSTIVIGRGRFGLAPGATRSALGAVGHAVPAGGWDAATSSFLASYRLVLGNLDSERGLYESDELNIKMLDIATPLVADSYVDARVDVDEPGPEWDLGGGDAEVRDRAYCLSRVTVRHASSGPVFFAPDVAGTGSFDGVDGLGRVARYDATLWWARGTPNAQSRATTEGQSVLMLPQGSWALTPSARFVNVDGSSTLAALPAFSIEVGCRQDIDAGPDAQVTLTTSAPPCVPDAVLPVAGSGRAAGGIAEIFWSVNGGPPQSWCVACGTDATFAFDAPLEDGDNVVVVEAVPVVAGAPARSVVFARHRPDGPADLRVTKDPAGLRLSWTGDARDTFGLHGGTIAALAAGAYDHAVVGACGRTGGGAVIAPPASDAYYLLTASCGSGEGSYGTSSRNLPRPTSPSPCP